MSRFTLLLGLFSSAWYDKEPPPPVINFQFVDNSQDKRSPANGFLMYSVSSIIYLNTGLNVYFCFSFIRFNRYIPYTAFRMTSNKKSYVTLRNRGVSLFCYFGICKTFSVNSLIKIVKKIGIHYSAMHELDMSCPVGCTCKPTLSHQKAGIEVSTGAMRVALITIVYVNFSNSDSYSY